MDQDPQPVRLDHVGADLDRIAALAGTLGPSSVEPPEATRQALFDRVAAERQAGQRGDRRDAFARRWSMVALAASVLLVAAVGRTRPDVVRAPKAWRILESRVVGLHQRMLSGGVPGAMRPAGQGWIRQAMDTADMAGVAPPEFNLARVGWRPTAAFPIPGGGLAIHMRKGDEALTAAMIPAGADALPPGGLQTQVGPATLRSFDRDGVAWVFWHEGAVMCVVAARSDPASLLKIVTSGLCPS